MAIEKIWTVVAMHNDYGEDGTTYSGTSVITTGAFKSEEEAKKAGEDFINHLAIAYIKDIWFGPDGGGPDIEIRKHGPLVTEFAVEGVVTDMIYVDIREADLVIKK